jgi:hypothetical protein
VPAGVLCDFDLSSGFRHKLGKQVQIVAEHRPCGMAFFIFKIPARPLVTNKSLDCGNTSFRLTAAVLQRLEAFIFHAFRHLRRRTRTNSIADVYFLQFALVWFAIKSPVGHDGFNSFILRLITFQEIPELALIGCFLFIKLPVNDEAGGLLGNQQLIAEFDFRAGFATDDG